MTEASQPGANLPGWTHSYSGKVRDVYEPANAPAGTESPVLLVVASNRVSAFDHVLTPEIPGKGAMLTALTNWWFDRLPNMRNHLVTDTERDTLNQTTFAPDGIPAIPAELADRATLVWKLDMIPIECVVRGYLTGSALAEYQESGSVCGVELPSGLQDGDRLPEPIFTPAYKAPLGLHDENISFDQAVEIVGAEQATAIRDASLAVFSIASDVAAQHGLLLADTKFEFGTHPIDGALTLGDEVLTSDSSRYWDRERYEAGGPNRMASFDKQYLRDWLAANWDRSGEPPILPEHVVTNTADRYRELLTRLGVTPE